MVDFSKLDTIKASNEGIEVRLFHPATREDLDTFIRVLGRDSDAYKAKLHEQQQARAKKAQRGSLFQMTNPPTPDEIEQAAIGLLAAVTVSWSGVEISGEVLPFNYENAKRFYSEYPWVREQIDSEVHDRRNFTKS